ncbi:MAG: hypothetical protein GC138_05715 [Gammaproteobacteria bacterium]|nr:hypothetical protein [Gammaproteobacteria bacterium]
MNISVIRYVKTLVLLIVMLGAPALAMAHKVSMFAYVEGDQVFLEGYFADGKKALNSKVEAFDEQGKTLWSGTTNDKGEVTFPVPKIKGDLRITLTASMGHKAEYILKAAEMAGEPGTAEPAAKAATAPAPEAGAAVSGGGMAGVDEAALRRIVRREVGEAVMPVVRGLSELKERRGVSDIVGGIGIIGGFLGVYFFLQARKLREGGNKKT